MTSQFDFVLMVAAGSDPLAAAGYLRRMNRWQSAEALLPAARPT